MSDRIAVITRFHFDEDSKDFEWRYEYYKDKVLPCLLAQTDQDFCINIWCEPHHDELFKSLSDKINIIRIDKTNFHWNGNSIRDFANWSGVEGMDIAKIQVGLDSDDLLEPDFIAKVRELSVGDKARLMSFQPIKLDVKSGKKYKMKNYEMRKRCSPVFATYQPKDNVFAYYRSHYRMNKDPRWEVIYIPEGYCTMSIHSFNNRTKIIGEDELWEK
jgi:hypothetical protein